MPCVARWLRVRSFSAFNARICRLASGACKAPSSPMSEPERRHSCAWLHMLPHVFNAIMVHFSMTFEGGWQGLAGQVPEYTVRQTLTAFEDCSRQVMPTGPFQVHPQGQDFLPPALPLADGLQGLTAAMHLT